MKLVTYNIRYAFGQDERYDLARVAATVEGADLIAFQEVERNWRRSGMADQPAELARLLPGYYWAYGPAFDVDASHSNGDGSIHNRRRQFGTMLLSKAPIRATRLFVLPKLHSRCDFNMTTGALEGVVELAGRPIRIYSLHLSSLSSADRLIQLDALLALHRQAAGEGGAWTGEHSARSHDWACGEAPPPMPEEAILLGDFNCEPDSAEYRKLTSNGASLVDAWAAAGEEPEDGITWSPYPGARPNREMRLDYCFLSSPLESVVRKSWVDRGACGSDHYPLWIELDL
ncbi:MAG: endonuclease/exonuclease/phosphatase family protein [Pseudomonadota bacterium]